MVRLRLRVLEPSVTLDAMQRDLIIQFCSIFFSWLLTGLSNLPGEVSASAKFSPHWRYLHFPLSTLEPRLPFLPHSWKGTSCAAGKDHRPGDTSQLFWQLYPYFPCELGGPWCFCPANSSPNLWQCFADVKETKESASFSQGCVA